MPLERIKIPVDVSALDVGLHNLQEYLHILAMLRYLDFQFPSALCGILIVDPDSHSSSISEICEYERDEISPKLS